MANLKSIFVKGIDTLFSVFSEAVHVGVYTVIEDDGFATPITSTCPARCIFDTFSAKDVESLPFSSLIQPMDIKGIVPKDSTFTVPLSTKGSFVFPLHSGADVYTVVAYESDPFDILYTLLLRKN